ncbi:TonB-dependent receptor [Marinicella sp. S1101]|uniref:TonB-dependent receptor plug domain-containing protein n=1 Tax=Marinicella marina TaxID=2996016 RepID=UPI0022608341|nr:TonB-dependent receptor [Marinicella marina]MCX7554197.1 TonB-dependent receptor [Marinicella marina]MDJ1141110.1 TonB-dependent receptor [Marinicella marina]
MTKKLSCLCLLFLLASSYEVKAEIKTLKQWIFDYNHAGFNLFYSSDYLNQSTLNQPLSIEEATIPAFRSAIKNLKFDLQAVDGTTENTYVIKPQADNKTSVFIIHASDAESDMAISGFEVVGNEQNHTSSKGSVFITTTRQTDFSVKIKAKGYYPTDIQLLINPKKTQIINTQLTRLPLRLSDIRVSTSLVNFNNQSNSQTSLSRQDLDNKSTFNHDPLRAAERLAGTSSNGINGKVHTRGGNLNEALVLLDNRELRNPYHFKDFFSLFSTINDTVVDSIDFYSGVFPAEFGGRLSSVVDVQSNQWADLPNHEANMGFLSSSYTYRHHNTNKDRYYMMALRTGGQLIDKHLIKDVPINPEYDDGYFKTSQIINDQWSMSQHLLLSRDEITIDQDDETARADYHDQNLWLQWQYDDLRNHLINFQAYASRRHDRRLGSLNDTNTEAFVDDDIESTFQGLKFTHQWLISHSIVFDYGVDITAEETQISSFRNIKHDSDLVNLLGLNAEVIQSFQFEEHGVAIKSHANARYQANDNWVIDLGVHYLNQEWVSGGDLSPRLNIAYFPTSHTSWHVGLGRHQQAQHIDELLLEDAQPQYFQPASADLAVFEFNHRFANQWQFLSEIYYKKYSQTHPYYENLFNELHVLPDLFYDRIRLNPDDAKAAGIELTLQGKYRQLEWSSSYAYGDVKDQFESNQVPRSWNQKNAFKFYLGLPINQWRLDLNADYHNGWPTTIVTQSGNQLIIGERNQVTFEDFFQISLKLNKTWQSDLGMWKFELQLTNALNTKNPCCRDYFIETGSLTVEEKYGLPIVPNMRLGLSW